jgi:NADP-dependent 3-hydroxy acid dehydrogenase YdfG
MTNKKIVLVTGASSGFGQLTAQKLAAVGYWVFGTSRKSHPASVDRVIFFAEVEVKMLIS